MRYQKLGQTNLDVSAVCLGTWPLSGDWGGARGGPIAAVKRAFDLGVNFFDTANIYGAGVADEGLAQGLGDILTTHRDQVVISAKGGIARSQTHPGRTRRAASREMLTMQLEATLHALGTDYVDIYFVHWPDIDTPFHETADVLGEFKTSGKVRHIGVSNHDIAQMDAFAQHAAIDVVEVPYNLFSRGVEQEILPYCAERDFGIMTWSALAHGLLAGELTADTTFSSDDWRASCRLFSGETYEGLMSAVDQLRFIAGQRGTSPAALSLAWLLASPHDVVPIVGAQTPGHIESTLAALDIELMPIEANTIASFTSGAPSIALPEQFPLRHDGQVFVDEFQWGN